MDMFNKVILILILIVLMLNLYINYEEKNLSKETLKIEKESFVGELLSQYYGDLAICIEGQIEDDTSKDIAQIESECESRVRESELFKKIIENEGEKYLK